MDGEAWWAAVYEVAQSRTRLKRLGRQQQAGRYHLAENSEYLNVVQLVDYTSIFIVSLKREPLKLMTFFTILVNCVNL